MRQVFMRLSPPLPPPAIPLTSFLFPPLLLRLLGLFIVLYYLPLCQRNCWSC